MAAHAKATTFQASTSPIVTQTTVASCDGTLRTAPRDAINTSTWLTQNQAIDLLQVSRNSLQRWEREGLLRTARAVREGSRRAVIVYDPNELVRMPRPRRLSSENAEGELHARVFELFDEGATVREVVIATRETVSKINELREQWLDAGGADFVVGTQARATLEGYVGAFATIADLVLRVRDLAMTAVVATVPEDVSDAEIERGIVRALDAAGAP